MSVSSVLKQKGASVYTTTQDQLLLDAVVEFNKKRIGALLVVDKGGEITGIISERDILRTLMENDGGLRNLRVSDAMTYREKLVTATVAESVESVMAKMTRNRVRHVPVFDNGGGVAGIVSLGDMVQNRLIEMQLENDSMRNYIAHS